GRALFICRKTREEKPGQRNVHRCRLVQIMNPGKGQGEDRAGDAKRFEGTWQAVSVTHDGKELAKEKTEKMTLTVKGERYTLKTASETIEGTHKLDPSKNPRTIDAVRSAGPDRGKKILGIYE